MTEDKNTASFESSKEKTNSLIRHHVYASMGIGVIPVLFADFAGVSLIQLNLLRKLAHEYDVPFSKDMVKNLIAALVGGAGAASFGRVLYNLAKAIPVVGTVTGMAGVMLSGAASTYAVGKLFDRHFSEGGTFLTFDPEKARAFYAEMYENGKHVVADSVSKSS